MTLEKLRCKECGSDYPPEALYVCERCFGPLEVAYDSRDRRCGQLRHRIQGGPHVDVALRRVPAARRRRPPSTGRPAGRRSSAPIGWPSGSASRGLDQERRRQLPTLSFKDRVVVGRLTKAREFGFTTVACASTGNLANAVAAHAAAAGLDVLRLHPVRPRGAEGPRPPASTGRTWSRVHGTYDDVNRLCTEMSGKYGWGFVNVNLRPYYAEGSKTLAFEIAEQLGWRLPDHVVVPMAGGSLFTKIAQGFERVARGWA